MMRYQRKIMRRLTWQEILAIRDAYDRGEVRAQIARRYRVSESSVHSIGKRRTYKELTGRPYTGEQVTP